MEKGQVTGETVQGGQIWKYKAFLSYSRADDTRANWLHSHVEAFRTPRDLVNTPGDYGPVPRSLVKIFRDRTDLSGGGHLKPKLQNAIAGSEFLIVLCSPSAAKSEYVNAEIEMFCSLGRQDKIIAVISSGEPNSNDPATECFPPALRALDPLAPDLRDIREKSGRRIGDGENGGLYKLIAGMLGVDLDLIRQREQARQRKRLAFTASIAATFICLTFVATYLGWRASNSGQVAKDRLYSYFATRSAEIQARGDTVDAVKYALAGYDLSVAHRPVYTTKKIFESNLEKFRNRLASALYDTGESRLSLRLSSGSVTAKFSPDGKSFLTLGADHTANLWNTLDGRPLAKPLIHGDTVWFAAFSPDGTRLVTTSNDLKIRLWDAHSGKALGPAWQDQAGIVNWISYAPDGAWFVTGGDAGVATVYEANGARPRTLEALPGRPAHSGRILHIDVSPDGKRIVTASADHTARLWDAMLGRPIGRPLIHTSDVTVASFSKDGHLVVTASKDGTACVWISDTQVKLVCSPKRPSAIETALFSANGLQVLLAGDSQVAVMDLKSGRITTHTVSSSGKLSAVYSADGTKVLVTSGATVEVLSTQDLSPVTILRGHAQDINSLAVSKADGSVLTAAADGRVRLFAPAVSRLFVNGTYSKSSWLAATPDGLQLRDISASPDECAFEIWDGRKSRRRASFKRRGGPCTSAFFAPDGKSAVLMTDDDAISRADFVTGKLYPLSLPDAASRPTSVAVSSDGDVIAIAHKDGSNRVITWPGNTIKGVQWLDKPDNFTSAMLSSDKTRILTGDAQGNVKVWEKRDGSLIFALPALPGGAITGLSLSSDETKLSVWQGGDTGQGTVRVIDVARLTEPFKRLAEDACGRVLGDQDRTFSSAEINGDTLLQTLWSDHARDVCGNVHGFEPSDVALKARIMSVVSGVFKHLGFG